MTERAGDEPRGRAALPWRAVALAMLTRPRLWPTAARQWSRITPARWWRRAPYLPVPPRAYLEFRLETAYGRDASPRAADVVAYLEWCRDRHPRERAG